MEREPEEKELKYWAEAASAAEDTTAWKQRSDSPILHKENETMATLKEPTWCTVPRVSINCCFLDIFTERIAVKEYTKILQNNFVLSTGLIMCIGHCKGIRKLVFQALALPQGESSMIERWAKARNVSFRISLQWPIDIIKLPSWNTPYQRSTTVSLETYPFKILQTLSCTSNFNKVDITTLKMISSLYCAVSAT